MVQAARERVAQISLRMDTLEFCGADKAVEGSGTFATGVGCTEQLALVGRFVLGRGLETSLVR
jgi:hypothetical protein